MEGFQFEVGQIVYHKLGKKSKILILEKHAQFCYGGLRQNWYMCVLGVNDRGYVHLSFDPEKRFKFSEIELSVDPVNYPVANEIE